MKKRVIWAVAGTVVLAMTTGCSSSAQEDPAPTESAQAAPSPSSTATPTPTPEPLTCDTVLLEESVKWLTDSGLQGPIDETETQDPVLDRFEDFGGVLCTWAVPDSGVIATYGHSEIDDAEVAAIQSELTAMGFTRSEEGRQVIFSYVEMSGDSVLTDWAETFVFVPGRWYYTMGSPTQMSDFRQAP